MDPAEARSRESRAEELAKKSLELFKSSRQDDAVRSLREALSLAPRNPAVLAALQVLQQDAAVPPVSKLVHKFAVEGNFESGNAALRFLRDRNVSLQTSTAVGIMELLFDRIDHVPLSLTDQLIGEVLQVSRGGREHLADKLAVSGRNMLQLFNRLGNDSMDALVNVLLEPAAWKVSEQHSKSLRECFRLLLGQLGRGEEGSVGQDCTARSVARLLAGKADELHPFITQEGLERLLHLLDLRSPPDVRSHATLAVARFVETSEEVAQSMISKFMVSRLDMEGDDDLRIVFSVAAAIFPVVSQFTAQLFLTEGFVEGLVGLLQAKTPEVENAALEMLSAACVDKACRSSISTNCTDYLQSVVNSDATTRSTAAVVLAKVKYGVDQIPGKPIPQKDLNELAEVFKGLMLEEDEAAQDSSVEGLAYTTLNGPVKESLVKDHAFIKKLAQMLEASADKPSTMFGILTIVSNLTTYPPSLSEEQKKISQLKSYAEATPGIAQLPDPSESPKKVSARCAALLRADIVTALISVSKKPSPNTMSLISTILLSLAREQSHRRRIASDGGVKLALQFFSAAPDKVKPTAAHALARILVSVNPSHVFSSQVAISSAIRPLFSLLDDNPDRTDLLPIFEGLLALTNLASTDDNIRNLIIRVGWTQIEDRLLSSNAMVQRATVELICNLMASPQGVAQFADGSKAAQNRLHILLALADAEDLPTRRAAGGALAMLTEWDKAVEAVLNRERGVEIVLGMVSEDNEELRHRGLAVLGNLTDQGKAKLIEAGAEDVVRNALKGTRQPEILAVGVEVLKALRG